MAACTIEEDVDKRTAKFLEMEYPDLIWEKQNNANRKCSTWFQECKHYLQGSIETAIDECWHNDGEVVSHLACALSVKDVFDEVCKRCPEETLIRFNAFYPSAQ